MKDRCTHTEQDTRDGMNGWRLEVWAREKNLFCRAVNVQKHQTKFHVSFSFEFSNWLAFHSTVFLSKMARNFLFYYLAHKHRRLICKSLSSNILVLNTINTFTLKLHIYYSFHSPLDTTFGQLSFFWHINFERIHNQNGIRFKQTFYIKPLVRLIFPESIQDFGIDHIKFHCWPQIQRAQHPWMRCFLLPSSWKLPLVPVFDWLFRHDRYL